MLLTAVSDDDDDSLYLRALDDSVRAKRRKIFFVSLILILCGLLVYVYLSSAWEKLPLQNWLSSQLFLEKTKTNLSMLYGPVDIWTVEGDFMSPVYVAGQKVFVAADYYKNLSNSARAGEIVFVSVKSLKKDYLARVAAVEGDSFKNMSDYLYINNSGGELIVGRGEILYDQLNFYGSVVPKRKVIVLADNPSESFDSRYFGFFDMDQLAKVVK
jgi:signal peptidase I